MSTITEYYQSNQDVNPYTMESVEPSSRVQIIIDLIKEGTPSNGKILDVGCGDMLLARKLPEYDWVGLDVNPIMNKGKCVTHDIESTPYPFDSDSFDAIICSEVQEHLFDNVKVTKEIHRLLRPGGLYIVSTPNYDFIDHYLSHFREVIWDSGKSWTKEHIRQFTYESHKQILGLAGFKTCDYTGADPHYGSFFKTARMVLTAFIAQNFKLDDLKAQIQGDKLLSDMFPGHLHTIVVWTTK